MIALIWIYATLVLLGGLVGYLKVKSLKSLTSGIICGGALAIAAYLGQADPRTGFGLAAIIATMLILIFGVRFRKTQKFMPAGFLAMLSLGMAIAFITAYIRLA